jgi:hypothetical protein
VVSPERFARTELTPAAGPTISGFFVFLIARQVLVRNMHAVRTSSFNGKPKAPADLTRSRLRLAVKRVGLRPNAA